MGSSEKSSEGFAGRRVASAPLPPLIFAYMWRSGGMGVCSYS